MSTSHSRQSRPKSSTVLCSRMLRTLLYRVICPAVTLWPRRGGCGAGDFGGPGPADMVRLIRGSPSICAGFLFYSLSLSLFLARSVSACVASAWAAMRILLPRKQFRTDSLDAAPHSVVDRWDCTRRGSSPRILNGN
ncbi:hypothetical protein LY76DRAFT_593747 [Colletotrichum caudatum]|nr:hypothetical protein LY76DRAFT_593747 [Colletotrichum caudatum]